MKQEEVMKTRYAGFVLLLFLPLVLLGCAGNEVEFGSVEKTTQLRPGMMHEDVIKLMGKPKSVQFVGDKVVLKYSLHEYWKGWVPYYLVFAKGTGQLQEWYADEAEYQRNQDMWMGILKEFEKLQEEQAQQAAQSQGTNADGSYMEGYDPNANYYTDDYYWQGSGYHYED